MYLSESDDAAILGLQFINEIETDINRRRRETEERIIVPLPELNKNLLESSIEDSAAI